MAFKNFSKQTTECHRSLDIIKKGANIKKRKKEKNVCFLRIEHFLCSLALTYKAFDYVFALKRHRGMSWLIKTKIKTKQLTSKLNKGLPENDVMQEQKNRSPIQCQSLEFFHKLYATID